MTLAPIARIRQKQNGELESVDALITRLGSVKPAERKDAARKLATLGAAVTEPLIDRMRRESRNYRRRRYAAGILAIVDVGSYCYFATHLADPSKWPLMAVVIALCLPVALLNSSSNLQIEGSHLLSQLSDKLAIGPLAEALETRNAWVASPTRALAADALSRLLPQLERDDYDLLNSLQRKHLYRALDHAGLYNIELTAGIVHALGKIGDTDAIAPLNALLRNRYFIGRNSSIEGLALSAIKEIHNRISAEHASSTLVRPSAGVGPDDYLLTPAAEADGVNAKHLLRAVGDISTHEFREEAAAGGARRQAESFSNGRGDVCESSSRSEVDCVVHSRTVR